MKIQQIREIARQHGVEPGRLNKVELIRSIQRGEGNFDCFGKAWNGICDRYDCLWRSDCFTAATRGLSS
jgi:hypothetical protein